MQNLSQFNESAIISGFFGSHVGHFIDCGASGGVALSNTFELALNKDWHGLLIEASPLHFQTLLSNYVNRGGIELLNAAIWTERKLMKFHYNQWYYSSLVEKEEAGLYQAHYWVNTVIAEDLKAIQPECDLLSLDIESADLLVFPSLMAAYPACKLVCVEHAQNEAVKAEWHKLFAQYGLTVISESPENYIAKR